MPVRKWGPEQEIRPPAGIGIPSDVASLDDGGFVLTYVKYDSLTDADPEIAAQRYDAFGLKVGGEIAVNATTTGVQSGASVATLADGGFVITWTDESQTGGDTDGAAIRGQRFDADGAKVGAEFRANTVTANDQSGGDVTALDDGGWVVTWRDQSVEGSTGPDGAPVYSVLKMRRYEADGTPADSADSNVNTGNTYNHYAPVMATLANGDYVVAWNGVSTLPGDGGGGGGETIYVRRFDPLGNPRATETVAGPPNEGGEHSPSITALTNGGYVVTWQADQPGTDTRIVGQVFDAAGAKVGDFFNATLPGSFGAPQVAATPNGGFLVTWDDQEGTEPDPVYGSVRGQLYDSGGARIGVQFLVNTTTDGLEVGGRICALEDGRIVVSYASFTLVDDVRTDIASYFQIIDPRDGVVVGSSKADVLLGHDALSDEINGYAGDDVMRGLKGDDQLYGGAGKDTAYGGAGDDDAFGGAGNDTLLGDAGDDTLRGEAGDDQLRGGVGFDTMIGGAGDDQFFFNDKGDVVVEASGTGQGTVDTIYANVSVVNAANVERVILTDTTNINATGLSGQADQLFGNSGNNILNGMGGNDTLTGKAGADVFQFTTAPNAATNLDRIADFVAVDDTIQIDNAVFTGLTEGALAATAFKIIGGPGGGTVDASDRIIYNAATGALFFDSDGSGAAARVQFATLTGAPAVSETDFVVI